MSHLLSGKNLLRIGITACALAGFVALTSLWSPSSSSAGSLGVELPEEQDSQQHEGAQQLGILSGSQLDIIIYPGTDAPLFTAVENATGATVAEHFTAEESASVLSEFDIDLKAMLATPMGEVLVPIDEF